LVQFLMLDDQGPVPIERRRQLAQQRLARRGREIDARDRSAQPGIQRRDGDHTHGFTQTDVAE